MQVERAGVILNTANYEACVAFYRDVLGLDVLFSEGREGDRLCCFEFGDAYLMVETGGHANPAGKGIREGAAKLRLNVRSLEDAQRHLAERGVRAEISRFDWGSVIDIFDPDGNRIGIRQESEFARQLG